MTEKRNYNDKFMLRLPDGMRKNIKRAADSNGRSMNAEIVALLEERFPSQHTLEEMIAQQFKDVEVMDLEERRSYFATMAAGFRGIAADTKHAADAAKFREMADGFEEMSVLILMSRGEADE